MNEEQGIYLEPVEWVDEGDVEGVEQGEQVPHLERPKESITKILHILV